MLFIVKRKIKKGVKILTSLIDGVVTLDIKDLMNSSSPLTLGGRAGIAFDNEDNE